MTSRECADADGYGLARRCIACGGSGHSHRACILLGAALHRKLDPYKDMKDVVDVILRLLLWNWRDARIDEKILCLSFAPSCDVIVAGSRTTSSQTGKLFFIDAQTGEKILCPVNCGSAVYSIAIKDNMIAAGCYGGEIKLFALPQSGDWGEIQSQFSLSCGSSVFSIAFKDNMLAAGCFGGQIKMFSFQQSGNRGEIQSESPLKGVLDDTIECRWAKFSTRDKEVTGMCMDVVMCKPEKADADITNAEQLVGKMAAVYRGECTFQEKTERLTAAGAHGIIIINNEDKLFEAPSRDDSYSTKIPVVMIQAKDAQALLTSGNSSCLRNDPCISTLSCGSPVISIAFKDNMIAAGCGSGKIKMFRLNESQDWREIQSEPPLSCGSYVSSIDLKDNTIAAGCSSGEIKMFALKESGDWSEIRSESPLRGHSGWVKRVAFNPRDPEMIASCSLDGTIKVWNIISGVCLSTMTRHSSQMKAVVFSTDGRWLISGSRDGTIRLWDAYPAATVVSPV